LAPRASPDVVVELGAMLGEDLLRRDDVLDVVRGR
jgi:hypothetical protein